MTTQLFYSLSPKAYATFVAILSGNATGHRAGALGKLLQHGLIAMSDGGYSVPGSVVAEYERWVGGGAAS